MSRECRIDLNSSGGSVTRETERCVAQLADRHHGVVARFHLVDAGLTRAEIDHRVARGSLIPLHRGVYAVGHRALSVRGRWIAAVFAGGRGAVLSHRSAAALWGIRGSDRAAIEISTPSRGGERSGLEAHRAHLVADEITIREQIPVTTPARTLFDLAAVLDRHRLERATHEAEVLRLLSPASLPVLLERHPGRRGAKHLRAILDDLRERGATVTKSELENRFLSVVVRAGLPRPRINADVPTALRAYEVDATWAAARLAVELDGAAAHRTRRAFEEDRLRDRALAVAGWRTIRITWHELRAHPDRVAADLQGLLSMPVVGVPEDPNPAGRTAEAG